METWLAPIATFKRKQEKITNDAKDLNGIKDNQVSQKDTQVVQGVDEKEKEKEKDKEKEKESFSNRTNHLNKDDFVNIENEFKVKQFKNNDVYVLLSRMQLSKIKSHSLKCAFCNIIFNFNQVCFVKGKHYAQWRLYNACYDDGSIYIDFDSIIPLGGNIDDLFDNKTICHYECYAAKEPPNKRRKCC